MQDGKLKKIEESGRIYSLFYQLRDHDKKCFIWRFVGDKKILAQVKINYVRKYTKDFSISVNLETEQENFDTIIGTTEEVNFYIPGDLVIFRAKLININNNNSIDFKIPPFIAQAERRKFFRINTFSKEVATAKFSKCTVFPRVQTQHFQKKCFDVSAGGVSLIISKIEAKFFQTDDEIPQIEFNLDGYIFLADAKVVASHEIAPGASEDILYKVQRINLKFTNISRKDFEYISQYIFERIDFEKDAV